MNFLAHIYLSGEDKEIVLGNFFADSIKGKAYLKYPLGIQRGVVLHRAIDFYTDTHPTVKRSTSRLFNNYGHYNGVIVDILYDHFLAVHWQRFSPVPLEIFIARFYDLLQDHYDILPKPVQQFMPYMIRDNWLLSYSTVEGIGRILSQMNERTKRISGMHSAVVELEEYYEEFETEFLSFFEELRLFVEKKLKSI